MAHYFPNVPGLGNVAVSRHAQDRMREDKIAARDFEDVLVNGRQVPDGIGVIVREGLGIRIVILERPTPFRGAKLVKTVFRVNAQL